eukprot:1017460-Pyramimonas_sp.AAC.1
MLCTPPVPILLDVSGHGSVVSSSSADSTASTPFSPESVQHQRTSILSICIVQKDAVFVEMHPLGIASISGLSGTAPFHN